MNYDIADRIAAILEDVLNRKVRIPYTERPVDWLPPSCYEAFVDLLFEEFDELSGELDGIDSMSFEELQDEIERVISEK